MGVWKKIQNTHYIKTISVGKFVVCGCDRWKCREFLFSLKNLAPQVRGDGCQGLRYWEPPCASVMKGIVKESHFDADAVCGSQHYLPRSYCRV